MSEFQELETVFTADTKQFTGGVKKLDKSLDKAGKSGDKAGRKLSTSFDAVGKSLSKAKGAAGVAAAGVAALGAAMAIAASRAKELNEVLLVSERTGINPEAFQRLTFAAQQFGVEADVMSDAMKDLSERIADAAANGGSYEEALQRIGLSGKELIGLNMEQQFFKVGGAIGELGTQADKAFVSMELMADGGFQLVQLFDQGEAGMKAMADGADELGIVLGKDALLAAREFDKSMTNLIASSKVLANELITLLGPGLERIAGATKDLSMWMRGMDSDTAKATRAQNELIDAQWKETEAADAVIQSQIALNKARRSGDTKAVEAAVSAQVEAMNKLIGANVALKDIGVNRQEIANKHWQDEVFMVQRVVDAMAALGHGMEELNAVETVEAETGMRPMVATTDDIIANLTKIRDELLGLASADTVLDFPVPEGIVLMQEQLNRTKMTEQGLHDQRIELLNNYQAALIENANRLDKVDEEQAGKLWERSQEINILRQDENARFNKTLEDQDKASAMKRKATQQQLTQGLSGLFGNLSAAMNKENRKQFEIAKQAQTAQAVVNTYQAATGAYAAMASIPVVGPALGIAAAAAAVAAGLANVSAIQSTSFGGGGGGAPAAPAGGGTGTVADGALTNRDITQFDISLQGQELYSGSQIDSLIGAINDRTDDNVELRANVS